MYRALLVVVMMCFVGLYVTDGQVRSPQKEMKLLTESLFAKEVNKDEVLIKEILQSWQAQYQQLKSFSFEIDVETIDNSLGTKRSSFSNSKCNVKLLMHSHGNCSVRLETLSDKKQPAITYILHNDRIISLDHQSKRYASQVLDKTCDKHEVEDWAKILFAAVPFFVDKASDLNERFVMTIPYKDEHHTWIRMEPRTDKERRNTSVGQMGIVNYRNTISPRYFPLLIMWREPCGNEVRWNFKKVTFNDTKLVKASDFEIDAEQLVLRGWSGSKTDTPSLFIRWIRGPSSK